MTFIVDGTNGLTFPNSTVQASAGNVLQVVNANTTTSFTTTSTTGVDIGLSATITPKFSTSKILITVHIGGAGKYTTDTRFSMYLIRNSTQISTFTVAAGFSQSTNFNYIGSVSTEYLDSPATTSATTYKVQMINILGTGTVVAQIDSSMSTITLTEIAA